MKHKLFPDPVGWIIKVSLPLIAAAIVSFCHFCNVVRKKCLAASPHIMVSWADPEREDCVF